MTTRIEQVRIRANTDDALAAQMRGEAALRSLDLEPAAMPARMILCIRAMHDPLPGGLDLRSAHAPRATEWERAARNAVNDALRRAVRPAREIVPATAEAVLFADYAELLACAARDAGDGFLAAWWWPHLLRGATVDDVIREWALHPQSVAAAMELLVRNGGAVKFVQTMPPRDAIEILVKTLETHGLAHAARELAGGWIHGPALDGLPVAPLPQPLIVSGLLESSTTIEQRLFAIVTVAIRRTPLLLRSAATTRALIATVAATTSPQRSTAVVQQLEPTPSSHDEDHVSTPAPRVRKRSAAAEIERQGEGAAQRTDTSEAPSASPLTTKASLDPQKAIVRAAKQPTITEEPAVDTRRRTISPEPGEIPPAPFPIEETISTRFAGVFFLINVAIALGFYDPYGREAPIDLDIWDFLALIGRSLVPQIEEDDVWPLLTALAQRTDDDELPPLEDEFLDRVRESIALILPDITDAEEAAAFVIGRPGSITVSPVHIDVNFCLAAHPIEIRIAGLDRDPGWIPAAGRHVAFHFD